MRRSARRLLTCWLWLLLSLPLFAITVSPPPSREYVAQTWVGFSTDDSFTIRFDLATDGKGKGSLLHFDEPPEVFDVILWELKEDRITVNVRFRSPNERTARFEGAFKQYLLSYVEGMLPHPERIGEGWIPGRLELSIPRGKGTLRFGAYPEQELLKRLQRLGSASAASP